jgi:hypothetical protein
MTDLFIKCIYCGSLCPFDVDKKNIHYEDSLRRCPVFCIDELECFTCGVLGCHLFSKEELNKPHFKRCRTCVKEGNIKRFQKFTKLKKNKGERLIDAIKEFDIHLVKKLLNKGVDPNYIIQGRLHDDEKSVLPDIFEDIDEYKYVSLYDKLWDKNGTLLPSDLDEYNESPTTPLKVVVDVAGENKFDSLISLKLFTIAQILINNGATTQGAREYWEYKYYDVNLQKLNLQNLRLKPYLLIGLLINS